MSAAGLARLGVQGEPAGREEVESRIAEVLAREGFGQSESWIDAALRQLFGGLGLSDGELPELAVWSTAIVVAFLIAWFLVRAWSASSADERAGASLSSTAAERRRERASALAEQAAQAHAAGELRTALRLYFWSLVLALSRRGELEYNEAWTNRELLLRGEPEPATAARLAPWVDALDAKGFGTERVSDDDVRGLAALWHELGGEPRLEARGMTRAKRGEASS